MRVYALMLFSIACELGMACGVGTLGKWELWRQGCLRGANVWQKIVEAGDDLNAIGTNPVGPPYSAASFRDLASWGANYVHLSHPGLFTSRAPYKPSAIAQDNIDDLVAKAYRAGLYVVIGFRTGPGRTEKAFTTEGKAEDHKVWRNRKAQDAWVAMWRATAKRYRNHPAVVGYDLMIEPNSNGALLNIYEPEPFFKKYGDTLYNWYPLAERIARAIRQEDTETPILIGGMNWSSASWLKTIPDMKVPHTVYLVHQYEPFVYSHQKAPFSNVYPGHFDGNYDGTVDFVAKPFLKELMSAIPEFQRERNAVVAVTEFGASRWQPGAEIFLRDQYEIFDEWKLSSAVWMWECDFAGVDWDDFNFRRGTDPSNHVDVPGNIFEKELRRAWSLNLARLPVAPIRAARSR